MKKVFSNLLFRLVVGIIVGILLGSIGPAFGVGDTEVFKDFMGVVLTFSGLFSEFLNFIIPLLILTFVSVSLGHLGQKAGGLFGITIVCAYGFTVISGLAAYAGGAVLLPGVISPITGEAAAAAEYSAIFTIECDPVCGVMPALVLAFVLGLGMAFTWNDGPLLQVLDHVRNIIALVLEKVIIPLIPVYIACSFCNIAATGELLSTIIMFLTLFICIIVGQWLIIAVEYGIASVVTHRNQFGKMKNVVPAYFTAVGTQSSAATIPVNLRCALRNEVSEDVARFVIPLCATIHLAGDTVCLVLGSMGIMMAVGMDPSFGKFLPFILMLGVTMVAAPGVPGGGVMAALGIITSMLGFDEKMQQLIISLHFSQDSFGTATNVTGDHAIAFIVDWFDERRSKKLNVATTVADDDAEPILRVPEGVSDRKSEDEMLGFTEDSKF